MKTSQSALNESFFIKLHDFSNFLVKRLIKMTELQLISKLSEMEPQQETPTTTISSIRVKAPKRILHFSDGVLEEYSSDDEIDGTSNEKKQCDEVKFQIHCHPVHIRNCRVRAT